MALTRRWRERHTHTDKDTKTTQVTTEERCAYAVSSLNAWREDWAPHDMREACKAR